MRWRQWLDTQRIWLNSTGMEHVDINLYRVGPMFSVSGGWDDYMVDLPDSLHLTIKGAEQEMVRRIIKERRRRNG